MARDVEADGLKNRPNAREQTAGKEQFARQTAAGAREGGDEDTGKNQPPRKRFPATPAPPPATTTRWRRPQGWRRHSTISRVSVRPIRRKARKMQLPPQAKAHRARQKEPRSRSAAPAVTHCMRQRASRQSATHINAPHSPAPREETGGLRSTHAREGKEKRSYESGVHPKGLWANHQCEAKAEKKTSQAHPAESSVQCRIRLVEQSGGAVFSMWPRRSRRLSDAQGGDACPPGVRQPPPL